MATFLFSSQAEPALFVTSSTTDKLVTVACLSIVRFVGSIGCFQCLIVVFEQNCFIQWNLLTINYYPNIVLPFPSCFSSRVFLKRGGSQLVYGLIIIVKIRSNLDNAFCILEYCYNKIKHFYSKQNENESK